MRTAISSKITLFLSPTNKIVKLKKHLRRKEEQVRVRYSGPDACCGASSAADMSHAISDTSVPVVTRIPRFLGKADCKYNNGV
jgi:hypothetical protein